MTIPGDGDDARRPEDELPLPRDGGPRGAREGEPTRSELSAAVFDDIVAGWNAEGRVPQWPAPADEPPPEPLATAEPVAVPDPEPVSEDAHFVPPEPPPLPRIGPLAVVGLVLLGLGLLLLIAPALVGVPAPLGVPLGLVALACGVGWLVLRLWSAPPPPGDGDGEDDGAVL